MVFWSSKCVAQQGHCIEFEHWMLLQQHCEQIVFPHLSWIGLATTSKQMQHKSWSRKGDCSNCGLVSSSLKGGCGAIEWIYWTTALGVTPVGLPLPFTALGCLPPFATCWKCEQIYVFKLQDPISF